MSCELQAEKKMKLEKQTCLKRLSEFECRPDGLVVKASQCGNERQENLAGESSQQGSGGKNPPLDRPVDLVSSSKAKVLNF